MAKDALRKVRFSSDTKKSKSDSASAQEEQLFDNENDSRPSAPLASGRLSRSKTKTPGIVNDFLDTPEPPSKRQRLARRQGNKPLYDAKFHPMDSITRPGHAATKRFNAINVVDDSNDESESTLHDHSSIQDSDEDDSGSRLLTGRQQKTDTKPKELPVRQSSRSIVHERPAPNYKKSWHPIDDLERSKHAIANPINFNLNIHVSSSQEGSETSNARNLESTNKEPLRCQTEQEQPAEDTDRRRSSRRPPGSASGRESIYDMKVHPMDKALRPKSAMKRAQNTSKIEFNKIPPPRRRNLKEGSPTKKSAAPQTSMSSGSKLSFENPPVLSHDSQTLPLVFSRLWNPYVQPRQLDWYQLENLDRQIYLLQQGAPVGKSQVLQMGWDEIKEFLFEEGEITFDERNSVEGTMFVTERYENVRLGIEAFFVAKPEVTDKRQWTLYRAEDPSVFHGERGIKYWRHLKDSIVEPISTTARKVELGEVEDSEDDIEEKTCDDGNETTKEELPSTVLQSDEILTSYDHNTEALIGQNADSDLDATYVKDIQNSSYTANRTEDGIMNKAELDSLLDYLSSSGSSSAPIPKPTASPDIDTHTTEASDATTPLIPKPTMRKTKSTPKSKDKNKRISVHEDTPNRSPELRKYVAQNPASPGTDIPKENMSTSSQGDSAAEISHEISSHPNTPSNQRFRAVRASPMAMGALSSSEAAIDGGQYISMFGGPLGMGRSS